MTARGPYKTPAAFRRALTDKLRELANNSRWGLPQLQQQIAYDRLLERLYLVDDGWIVKGAVALLARDIGVPASKDIDVYREGERSEIEAELREAAACDIGDWFRFEVGPTQAVSDGAAGGVRLPVKAYVGDTLWASFPVDVVGADIPYDRASRGHAADRARCNARCRAKRVSGLTACRPRRRQGCCHL